MVQETVKMKYLYICYTTLSSEHSLESFTETMASLKEEAAKRGFHLKYKGAPYGVSEQMVVIYESDNDPKAYLNMFLSIEVPYTGGRTNIIVLM